MKKNLIKVFVIAGLALTAALTISLTSVSADSVYEEYSLTSTSEVTINPETEYTLEEMLLYVLWDEYMAQAEYNVIIDTFGEIRPFTMIVKAEQTHINLLLPLFEEYEIEIPENTAADYVVIPESITSAINTGVESETANIKMYQTFLAQDNLPDDVRAAFESLVSTSQHHLDAFSSDRSSYYRTDMMNQFKKIFQHGGESKGQENSSGNQYRGSNGQRGSQGGYLGDCPNA